MSETPPSPTPAIFRPGPADGTFAHTASPSESPEILSDPFKPIGPARPGDLGRVITAQGDPYGKTGARNLVVCIDGTSNQFSTKNTNVVELYSRLVKDEQQLTFYNSGIGTYAKPSWKSWGYRKQVIANKLDLAFALRFEKIILSAYAWLVDNYKPEDRIFLFGFSRGAYQVRALAAMIDAVGLLYKGNNDQIPFAYELYAASDDEGKAEESANASILILSSFLGAIATRVKRVILRTATSVPLAEPVAQPSETDSSVRRMQKQFKKTFSQPEFAVHFVGAWDTVSSVGLIRDKTLPNTTNGMKCATFFRHALALHEVRVKFLPEYVNGNRGPDPEVNSEGTDPEVHSEGINSEIQSELTDSGDSGVHSKGPEPHTKEVWFSGSHSDIGGGSTTNMALDKFGPALRWMSHEAEIAGLRIKKGPRSWTQNFSESMTFIWRIVEYLPIKRLSYKHWDPNLQDDDVRNRSASGENDPPGKLATSWLPHLCAHREIQPGQRIYRPVLLQDAPFQLPRFALPEEDPYMEAAIVLRPLDEVLELGCIIDERNTALLALLVDFENGIESLEQQHVERYVYNTALSCWNAEAAPRILKDLRLLHNAYIRGALKFKAKVAADDVTEASSTATFPFHMCGHTQPVPEIAFLSDTRVISVSSDKTVRTWDVITGVSTGKTTLGIPRLSADYEHFDEFTLHAAKGIVAGLSSGGGMPTSTTISLWKTDSKEAVRTWTIASGDGRFFSLKALDFSPTGSHLVSGSTDGLIRIWNVATGELVGQPGRGHTDWVHAVAFSPDGKSIASGCVGHTVRLWDWSPDGEAPKPRGEPLNGHTDWIWSVSFSPDSRVVASGSKDGIVRIWDVATHASKFVLEGHTSVIYTIAFAPSGSHVASASADWTARIWDARTGAPLRVICSHTDSVISVAFSPDGRRIALGARDNTVSVWDFDVESNEPQNREEVEIVTAPITSA